LIRLRFVVDAAVGMRLFGVKKCLASVEFDAFRIDFVVADFGFDEEDIRDSRRLTASL
jgi:hypothetical protein